MSEVTSAPDAASPVATTSAQAAPASAPVLAPDHRTREAQKTPEQRAEDIAYTLNHAVSCATTDIFIVPTIAAGFKPSKTNYFKELTGYMGGEIVGDFAAVPLTIMVQRFFPAFMEMVGRVIDPVAKPLFRHGAHEAAERWGRKHGYAEGDVEVVDRAQHIYQHEMQHLPQAIVWNMFSFPLGVVGQKWMGHEGGYANIARNKLLGTAISNVILIGGRALLPDKAEKFDRADGKHIIRPVTRVLSGLVGIDSNVVDRMDAKADAEDRRENGNWQKRVAQQDQNAPAVQQGV